MIQVEGSGLPDRGAGESFGLTASVTSGPGPSLDEWVNPLVCVCPEPDADPARNFGECSICRREPLELMAAAS